VLDRARGGFFATLAMNFYLRYFSSRYKK
jgi:hypothetical protein